VDQNGNVIEEDADPTTINLEEQDGQVLEAKKRNASLDELSLKYPVFVTPREQPFQAYCIPIYGKGLWSTLYGYLALESDANTVRGITFYKHGETPGLGAEIENPNWQKEFVGKKILDDQGELVSIEVVKGRAPEESLHQVDGLSGATITSRGVQTLVKDALTKYRPYFEQIWKQKGS
jgi:Na+-transporting NADH:ubiquinone oxidoreductase subunit C